MNLFNPDDIAPVLTELKAQTDRGMAIIGAAMIDDMLTLVLQQRLILNKALQESRGIG